MIVIYQPFRKGFCMKVRFISGMVALLLSVSMAMAAEDVAGSITSGSKALLFTFSGLNSLGANAYNGGIGGKYFLNNALAIRASLQFTNNSTSTPAVSPNTLDGSSSSTRVGITAGGEYHLLTSRVSPYVGAALGLSSLTNDTKTSAVSAATQQETKNAIGSTAGMTFSIGALGGIEFFLTKELSLGAEYQLGWSSTSGYDQESTNGTNPTEKTKTGSSQFIGISNGGALTLSVYF